MKFTRKELIGKTITGIKGQPEVTIAKVYSASNNTFSKDSPHFKAERQIEFIDTNGNYRHWKQDLDGGELI